MHDAFHLRKALFPLFVVDHVIFVCEDKCAYTSFALDDTGQTTKQTKSQIMSIKERLQERRTCCCSEVHQS